MKVLIFGLPGSGKTTMAASVVDTIPNCVHINADIMRQEYNDWDFSEAGRWRQFERMKNKADAVSDSGRIAVCDFVCPYKEGREKFGADVTIFMGTCTESIYDDTNSVFEWPEWTEYDYDIPDFERYDHVTICWFIGDKLWNNTKPTVQMLGRYQPWHEGHQALLDRALEKTGQVELMIRDMPLDDNNPYTAGQVIHNLEYKLVKYAGRVKLSKVSNIVNITYGRDVGYKIEQEHFDKDIEDISATKIRQKLATDSF